MYEDIEVKGGIWRYSHWRLWQEKTGYETYGARRLRSFVVLFLLCWVIETTVLLSGVQENQSEWLKWCLNQKLVFEWRLWERILSRVRQVSFACSSSKVAVWVWNLTVRTCVSSLVIQGHFGRIRSGCQVARARENWVSLKSSCLCDLKTYYTWGLCILQLVKRCVLSIQETLWIIGERSL